MKQISKGAWVDSIIYSIIKKNSGQDEKQIEALHELFCLVEDKARRLEEAYVMIDRLRTELVAARRREMKLRHEAELFISEIESALAPESVRKDLAA